VGVKYYSMYDVKLVLSSLRRDIGGEYASRELKGILKEFLREQAFVKAEGRTVHVTPY